MDKFNVSFLWEKDLILALVSFCGENVRPSTGIKVFRSNFYEGKESQYIKNTDPEYKEKNKKLGKHKAFLDDLLKKTEYFPEVGEYIKQQYNYFKKPYLAQRQVVVANQKDLLAYFREWTCGRAGIEWRSQGHVQFLEQLSHLFSTKATEEDRNKMKFTVNTIKNDRSAYNTLYNFESAKLYKLTPTTINFAFEEKFNEYVLIDLQQNESTYSKHIGIIKNFCWWLDKVKKVKGIEGDYDSFEKVSGVKKKEIPLNAKELLAFHNASFSQDELMEKGRLVMLTLCSTGQHITDYNEHLEEALNNKMEEDGHEFLLMYRHKNEQPYIIPYYDNEYFKPVYYMNELIKRYGGLPKMLEKDINEALVYICKELGITRKITSKYGRRTFASIHTYILKTPTRITMKATGHTTERSFNDYLGVNYGDIVAGFKETAKPL